MYHKTIDCIERFYNYFNKNRKAQSLFRLLSVSLLTHQDFRKELFIAQHIGLSQFFFPISFSRNAKLKKTAWHKYKNVKLYIFLYNTILSVYKEIIKDLIQSYLKLNH